LPPAEIHNASSSWAAAQSKRSRPSSTVSRGLASLREGAAGLANVSSALDQMLLDADLAWRAYACALLADELAD
jgi:hypothetical protein